MSKWFFAPLNDAGAKMRDLFPGDISCTYQIISDDRVVEHWRCRKDEISEWTEVLLTVVKHGESASIIIYQLIPIASKHFNKQP